MTKKSVLQIAGFLLSLPLTSIPAVRAQNPPRTGDARSPAAMVVRGILSERLSRKQLSLWNSLVRLIQATDAAGLPRYPRLHGLWCEATSSGRALYIEMPEPERGIRADSFRFTVGTFVAEGADWDEKDHPAVIRLHRDVIDRAAVDPGDDGFEQFKGLGKYERYLEVLAHELAHAVFAFRDREYFQKIRDLEGETVAFRECWLRHKKQPRACEELARRADRIETLARALEGPARSVEAEVWRDGQERRRCVSE